jgi:hypothetical protein
MTSAEQIARELAEVGELLTAQVAVGLSHDDVVECLYRSWAERLQACTHYSEKGKSIVTNVLREGPWNPEQLRELARVVLTGGKNVGAKVMRRVNQKCTLFENLIPESVWVKLRDTRKFSQVSRVSLIAGVGHSLGLECPDQPTLYRMVAIIAYCENTYEMNQETVHSLMDKIQTFLKAQARVAGLPYLEHYPSSASQLPEDMQKKAYPNEELPVDINIPELAIILGDNKLRGRPKHVAPAWLQHVPEEYRSLFASKGRPGSSGTLPLNAATAAPAIPAALPTADVLRFHMQKTPESAPLANGEPDASLPGDVVVPFQDKHAVADATAGTVEDMEKAFVAAMRKGKATPTIKRPAAAACVIKRPAAAACAIKRPAAATKQPASAIKMTAAAAPGNKVNMNEMFAKLRSETTMPRKNFTSKAYHGAAKLARDAGCAPGECTRIAREASAMASMMWSRSQR